MLGVKTTKFDPVFSTPLYVFKYVFMYFKHGDIFIYLIATLLNSAQLVLCRARLNPFGISSKESL